MPSTETPAALPASLEAPSDSLSGREPLEDALRRIATRIREIILATPPDKRPERLATFPHGSCGDTAMIMGTYLIRKGHAKAEYVVGVDGQHSHAWLECDGIIIDITADQFEDEIVPVLVTRDRTWHSLFAGQERQSCDFRDYQDPTIYQLYDFYEAMASAMEQSPA
jgi:hypothetical protein